MDYFCLFCIASLILAPAFAATPPTAPLTDDLIIERLNSTLPLSFNSSTSLDSSLPNAQQDPWDIPIPLTDLILEWYAYRDPFNALDGARCIEKALSEAADRVRRGDDRTPLASLPYSYSDGEVNLWLKVGSGKTLFWGMWARVLHQFPIYVLRNDWRGAQFLVFVEAGGEVLANGHLLAE